MTPQHETDVAILTALLEKKGEFISGEELASQLGISRVSIWNRMKKLEEAGFQFNALRNRGYQLQQEPAVLHPSLLHAYAQLMQVQFPLHAYTTIDSTNSEVERLLVAGQSPPFAVLASEQSKGRGRLGRDWNSPSCGNLYLSIALRPDIPLERMQTFTLWMGVIIARLLIGLTGLPLQIKWPNDLLCRGRKVAGILTEARIDNDRLKELVLGVGFNINARQTHFPESLRQKATSLSHEAGRPFPLHRLAIQILQCIHSGWGKLEAGDIAGPLLEQWDQLDYLRGKPVSVTSGNRQTEGTADGIDAEGSLLIRNPNGVTMKVRAGDVTLESNYSG